MPDDILSTYLYYTARKTTNTRILKSDFGDGYSQRAGDGINTTPDTWEVEFRSNSTNIATIVSTLESKAGHTSFTWTAPSDSTAKKWICKSWSWSSLGNTMRSLTATFEEVFDL